MNYKDLPIIILGIFLFFYVSSVKNESLKEKQTIENRMLRMEERTNRLYEIFFDTIKEN